MDSKVKIVEHLIEEGNSFTFKNFCQSGSRAVYAGTETVNWREWKLRSRRTVYQIMSQSSPAVELVNSGFSTRTYGNSIDSFNTAKDSIIRALNNTLEALKEDVYGELKEQKSESQSPAISNKVFVVHGHDNELKNDVERFIHEIGLEPIVLHRQVDGGATVIEKIEANSDVGYAFILLTPDEYAYTKDQQTLEESHRHIELRARPNVIFEFGYFVGKLGRNRVCCLHKGDVVVPSDISGLVYKKVESSIETQAYAIIRELKAAGYNLSM
ncbi:nucleotide-binding protein [Vibrio fluvialis]|nr:nucleotide-binding protein [Vibrio fluvialis]EKO3534833.1 nucleotide-binding protein [Vibrio fluvialis]ELP2651273.1 nucleotide-binding protein [Vibrio fluvialis]